ncbi:hypothetical protein [Ulvibacterium sp.]|uniref:hypothetical protein n=1 Tax=Ulvibacterium sp. TaxID=2665914 RepID=UPI003BAD18FE
MKTIRIFLFALLGCTSFVFSQSYSGVLTHTNSYFTMEPFNGSYDDGSAVRMFYDGNNKRIRFWNTDSGTSFTHIDVGNVDANGNLEATGNITASGSLGIGVTSPTAKLHFKDGNQELRFLTGSNSSGYRLDIGLNDDGVNINNSSNWRGFNFSNGLADLMKITYEGNVGIGTTAPNEKLDINGNILVDRMVKIDGHGSVASLQIMDNSDTGTPDILLRGDDGDSYIKAGSLGIGTMDTGTYKLAVNGNVRAKEVRVETGWSDFVFEKDYDLPTLEEVEKYIQDKGHLKGIPSAEEVAENGIFLGEMDSKLLRKIEELTLYIIDMNKRMELLEKENLQLKKESAETK